MEGKSPDIKDKPEPVIEPPNKGNIIIISVLVSLLSFVNSDLTGQPEFGCTDVRLKKKDKIGKKEKLDKDDKKKKDKLETKKKKKFEKDDKKGKTDDKAVGPKTNTKTESLEVEVVEESRGFDECMDEKFDYKLIGKKEVQPGAVIDYMSFDISVK